MEEIKDAELAKLVGYFEDAEDSTVDSRKDAERNRDYYDGKQLTTQELSQLKKRKQPPVVMNRVKPKIDFLIGMEIQSRTDPKAFPRTPKHDSAADAATDGIRYVCDKNEFPTIRSEVAENIMIEGAGGAEVYVKPKGKQFEIQIKFIPWDRIFYDPHSRARDFSDAKYKGIVLWMDRDDALDLSGTKEAEEAIKNTFDKASNSETFEDKPIKRWVDKKRDRVRVIQIEYKKGGQWWVAKYTYGGFIEPPRVSPYVDEYGEPCDSIILQSAFVDRDGNRYGLVNQLIGPQDEVNKRRSKGLHLINSRQTYGNRTAIADVNKTKQELQKPDGHLEIEDGVFGQDFGVIPTTDMTAGNLQMLQEAKNEIDAIGPNAAMSGKDEREMSGRALQSRQQGGVMELGPLMEAIRKFQHHVYRYVWYRIKQYWREETWVRVTDDENNLKWVGLNKPVTNGQMFIDELQAKGEQITPEIEAQIMSYPEAQQVVKIDNEVAELDVDIIIEDAPDTVTIQSEQFEMLTNIYPTIPDPMKPTAFEILIEASSLRNKRAILEKLKGGGQDPQQVAIQQQQAQKQEKMADDMHMIGMEAQQAKIERDRAAAMKDMAQAENTTNPQIPIQQQSY